MNPGPIKSQLRLQESHREAGAPGQGHVVVRLGAGQRAPPSRGLETEPCPAQAAEEEAIREDFLEKASTQRPTGGWAVRLGR